MSTTTQPKGEANMPYIVTTTTPAVGAEDVAEYVDRQAFATLWDARDAVITTIIDGPVRYGLDSHILATYRLPEQGGTIGPLPDGTVFEVEWVECALATLAPILETPTQYTAEARQRITEAFNAEQGS